MDANLLFEINNKKYLLFAYPIFKRTRSGFDKMVKAHKGIVQGVKELKSNFVIVNILIPEENAIAFSNDSEANYEQAPPRIQNPIFDALKMISGVIIPKRFL